MGTQPHPAVVAGAVAAVPISLNLRLPSWAGTAAELKSPLEQLLDAERLPPLPSGPPRPDGEEIELTHLQKPSEALAETDLLGEINKVEGAP